MYECAITYGALIGANVESAAARNMHFYFHSALCGERELFCQKVLLLCTYVPTPPRPIDPSTSAVKIIPLPLFPFLLRDSRRWRRLEAAAMMRRKGNGLSEAQTSTFFSVWGRYCSMYGMSRITPWPFLLFGCERR